MQFFPDSFFTFSILIFFVRLVILSYKINNLCNTNIPVGITLILKVKLKAIIVKLKRRVRQQAKQSAKPALARARRATYDLAPKSKDVFAQPGGRTPTSLCGADSNNGRYADPVTLPLTLSPF